MTEHQPMTPEQELRRALVRAQADAKAVAKDERNTHGGWNYASREGIASAIKDICSKHGLAFGMRGPVALDATSATWEATLTHESGAQESWLVVWAVDFSAKGMTREQRLGSAMSYALKNEMLSVFNVPRGEERDIDSLDNRHAHRAERALSSERRPPEDPDAEERRRLIDALTEETVRHDTATAARAMGLKGTLRQQDIATLRDLYQEVFPPL